MQPAAAFFHLRLLEYAGIKRVVITPKAPQEGGSLDEGLHPSTVLINTILCLSPTWVVAKPRSWNDSHSFKKNITGAEMSVKVADIKKISG